MDTFRCPKCGKETLKQGDFNEMILWDQTIFELVEIEILEGGNFIVYPPLLEQVFHIS